MSIKVNDSKDPVAEQDSLLVQVDYANQPIPNNRLPKGLYYSFKDKWVDMITLLTPAIKKIVTANTTVPAWGSITGTLSNQTDLQSALDDKMSSDLTDSHIFVGDATNKATDVEMTGDVTIDNLGVTTLSDTTVTAGTYGDATNVPQLTVDSKGRLTGVTNVAISGASVTPSALTKTDDTNVTLTLGGTPSTSLLQAVSLTLGWTGTLADGRIASASTWNAKQNALGYTPENVANKATSLTSPDNTKYPTTQAVADGLALKANILDTINIIGTYTIDTTLTGVTSETSLAYVLVPANTLIATDTLQIEGFLTRVAGTSTTVVRYRVSTSPTPVIASATLIATYNLSSVNLFLPFVRRNVHVDTASSTKFFSAGTSSVEDDLITSTLSSANIDWTVDQYIHVSAAPISSGDSITLHKLRLLK